MHGVQPADQGRLCGVQHEGVPPGVHEVLRVRGLAQGTVLHVGGQAHLRDALQSMSISLSIISFKVTK